MRFKHPAWIPIAWVLSGANLVSAWFAAVPGEAWHASIHALLALLFGLGAQRLAARRRALLAASPTSEISHADPALLEELDELRDRLAQLEERVDFAERVMAQVRDRPALGSRGEGGERVS